MKHPVWQLRAKQRSQRAAPPVQREAGLQAEQHALAASRRLKQEKIINWVRKRCTSLPARSPPSPARPPPPPVPPSPPPVPAESPLPRAAVAKGTKEPSWPENLVFELLPILSQTLDS